MDSRPLSKRPAGLSSLAEQMFDILARYTAFPWPVLMTQCQRLKLDPTQLTAAAASRELVKNLSTGVGRFTTPEKERRVHEELESLLTATLFTDGSHRGR